MRNLNEPPRLYISDTKIVKANLIENGKIKGYNVATEEFVYESLSNYKDVSVELVEIICSERVRTVLALEFSKTDTEASEIIGVSLRTFKRMLERNIFNARVNES